ncbi:MAG: hypothetical protein KA797_02845 [Chitinophagales bacterium]|nr:hypothetical protein [Chitinophagales bacterium]
MKYFYKTLFASLFCIQLHSQTLPPAQNLPFFTNFGTTTFTAYPIGIQGWNGINGGSVSTQALAEAANPTGNATLTAATSSQTGGNLYGYNATSTTNASLYAQGSSNATNGVNQICLAIKNGASSTLNISYLVKVINIGASGAAQGRELMYRDSTSSTWIAIPASVALYAPSAPSNNKGDNDVLGDIDTFNLTLTGLNTNRTYYFKWIHWRTSGTSVGTSYDDITFTAGASCAQPSNQSTAFLASNYTTTSARLNFTRGNGDSVLVLLKSGSAVNADPISGSTYSANSIFGSGSQLGTGNYAIYRGVGDSFSISNLNPNTTYHAAIYEFNGSGICYKNPALIGNFTTRCEVPTGQASISLVSPGINSAVVNFLSGTGGNARLLILSDSLLFNDPIDTTDPSANNNYSGSGAQIVYNSNGNSATILGLTSNKKYYLKIFEGNCSGNQRRYLTTPSIDSFMTNLPSSSESDFIQVDASEASVISSLENSNTPLAMNQGVKVWSFSIRDGGSDTLDADTFPTIISSLTLAQSLGNAVNDWSDAIQSVALFYDSTRIATGVVSANQLVFTGSPLLYVQDDSFANLSIRLSLQTSLNNTGGNLDRDDFGFSLSAANMLLASGSSQKSPGLAAIVSANDSNKIDIIATKLKFVQMPTTTGKNNTMNPSVTVESVDANNNRDLDFNTNIKLSSTGTMKVNEYVSTAANGLASFNSVKHLAIGSGLFLKAERNDSLDFDAWSDSFKIINTTTLRAGDLFVIAFDNNTAIGDKIVVTNLIDILPQTKFSLANACYDLKNASNIRSNKWYCNGNDNDDIYSHEFTWNGTTSIPRGAIICMDVPSSGLAYTLRINGADSSSKFLIVNDGGPTKSSPNISTSSPDGMFIVQGTWDYAGTHANLDGNVVAGFMTGAAWKLFSDDLSSTTGTTRLSRIPASLECLKVQGSTASGNYYKYYTGTRVGTKASLLASLSNPANWSNAAGDNTDNISALSPCNSVFTVNGIYRDTTIWAGQQDSNWFNCNNWDNLTIPDYSTNVWVKDTSTFSMSISSNAANANKYGSIANCQHLVVDSGKTFKLLANTDTCFIHGNLWLKNGSHLNLSTNSTNGGAFLLKGQWTNYSVLDNIDEGGSSIHFIGLDEQGYSSANTMGDSLNLIVINKAYQSKLVLNSILTAQSLILNNGIVATNSNVLTITNTISGHQLVNDSGNYNNNNYIQGKLKRNIPSNGNYFFPVGDSINGEGYNPVNLTILSGTGTATGEFIPGDPGTCNTMGTIRFNCGASQAFLKYTDMTSEGKWNFSGSTFNYNIQAYPNVLNVNVYPNDTNNIFSDNYRLLKTPSGTVDWSNAVLSGDSCFVSDNYYALVGNIYTGFSQFAPAGGAGNSTALPVQLTRFAGNVLDDNSAALVWETVSERNSYYFEIMKSTNGFDYRAIGKLTAKGFSNDWHQYNFIDVEPLHAIQYYFLNQVDFDGTIAKSNVISLNASGKKSQEPYVYLEGALLLFDSNKLYDFVLTDMSGKIFLQNFSNKIDLSGYAHQIYLLKLTDQNGYNRQFKIVY